MAKAIDHNERRNRIVAESLQLFATCGYSKVNFGMIAKHCGLARTILYTYFRDKREIFNEAIDQITRQVRATYDRTATLVGADAKLREICRTVFGLMFANRDFICTISDVLTDYRRKGSIPVERIKKHTEGLVQVFTRLITEGTEAGEFRDGLNADLMAGLFYSQFEAAALRIAVTGNAELPVCLNHIDSLLLAMKRI